MIAPMTLAENGALTGGEAIFFWVFAPLIVLAALGLIFAKKAVYAAISVVFVMIGLAFMYIAQDAMFLGVVQVVVYTGAIMMLFLFVLMLIGVDVEESHVENIKGQRAMEVLGGLGLLLVLIGTVVRVTLPAPTGFDADTVASNPVGVAGALFSNYPFAMQLTGALLIVAAVSAITLTTRERTRPKVTQPMLVDVKMKSWAERGTRIGQLPAPGVYATHNGAFVPALGPDGEPVVDSVPRVLRIRGQMMPLAEVAPHVLEERNDPTGQSQLPSMPGEPAPVYAPANDTGDAPEIEGGSKE